MQDEVRFMRIRTRRHELMISPGAYIAVLLLVLTLKPHGPDDRYLLAVLHDPAT